MSGYIAFDLDALNQVPHVARASGIADPVITHGLVHLWAFCFRAKRDVVTRIHLLGFFGSDAADALEAFGFLEAVAAGFRVKGAARYLRVAAGRSEGGKKATGNLKRGTTRASQIPRVEPEPSREEAGDAPRLDPGLSPTTDDRLPNTDVKEGAPVSSVVPIRQVAASPLIERLADTYRQVCGSDYPLNSRSDGDAMRVLLGYTGRLEDPEAEIERRWRIALQRTTYPACSTLKELSDQRVWAHANAPAKSATAPYSGIKAASEPDGPECELCGGHEQAADTAGHVLCASCVMAWWDSVDRARALAASDWMPWRASVAEVAHAS